MKVINIQIEDRVIKAMEAARINNKAPSEVPGKPHAILIAPVDESVEAMIQNIVDRGVAPYASQVPSDEQKALAAEIQAKTKELEAMSKPRIMVTIVD